MCCCFYEFTNKNDRYACHNILLDLITLSSIIFQSLQKTGGLLLRRLHNRSQNIYVKKRCVCVCVFVSVYGCACSMSPFPLHKAPQSHTSGHQLCYGALLVVGREKRQARRGYKREGKGDGKFIWKGCWVIFIDNKRLGPSQMYACLPLVGKILKLVFFFFFVVIHKMDLQPACPLFPSSCFHLSATSCLSYTFLAANCRGGRW